MDDAINHVQTPSQPFNIITANRRNGKPRSCEPCRKIKTRCDHRIPTCGRCQSRGISPECFYHPAPLTRNSSGLGRAADKTHARNRDNGGAQSIGAANSGPLHSSSRLSITAVNSSNGDVDLQTTDQSSPGHRKDKADGVIDEIQLADVFSCLPDLDLISALIHRWYQASQMCLVPLHFLDEALVSLKAAARDNSLEAKDLASNMFSASSRSLEILSGVEADNFHKQFTMSNLRLEIVGLLLTIAGLAASKLPASDTLFLTHTLSKVERVSLATDMLSVSDTLIDLCTRNFQPNDILIWLRSENLALAMSLRGNSNHRIWHISGQFFNDLLFLNFHRELGDDSGAPVFLDELRSQFFAAAFRVDKDLSATFAKPPRLPQHYCSKKMPLHLRHGDLVASSEALETTISLLHDDGWSVQPQFHPVTWLRARYIFSLFREEVLHIELGPVSPNTEDALRNIVDRVHSAWNAFPNYLHYVPSCWDTYASSYICFMLLVIYLEYLDLLFHTEKLIYSFTTRDDSALIAAASLLFTTTASSSRHISRTSGSHSDSVWSLLRYGLPSAIVLAMTLKKNAGLAQGVSSTSWADLYRQLSVLASNLEGIVESNDANSALYKGKHNCQFLLKTLDEALEARMNPPAKPTGAVTTPMATSDAGFNLSPTAGLVDLNGLDEGILGDFMSEINWADLTPSNMSEFGL
ncbi:hypothetical protein F5Y03DRAFT_247221 [Xylaria venustula]|nr:hypothetical protein F5Y03DRAFT_247221 [Xylaria venustula]